LQLLFEGSIFFISLRILAVLIKLSSWKGYLWAFPSSNFVVEKGDGTLKDYDFGKKTMAHKVRL